MIKETKPGQKIDKDINRFTAKGNLTTRTQTYERDPQTQISSLVTSHEKVNIGQQTSNVLDDMFVVLEIECYYPVPIPKTHVCSLSEVLTYVKLIYLFEMNDEITSAFLKSIDMVVRESNVSDDIKKHPVFKTIENIVSNLSDPSQIANGYRQLGVVRAVVPQIFETAFKRVLTDSFHTSTPDVKTVMNYYHLQLTSDLQLDPETNSIVHVDFNLTNKKIFQTIIEDLKTHFTDSKLYSGDNIVYLAKPKSGDTKDKTKWYITTDLSLGENFKNNGRLYFPIELITKAIPYNQFEASITYLSNLIKTIGIITTDLCSLNANIGFQVSRSIDLLKICILTNDERELKLYNRDTNKFTISQLTKMQNRPSEINDRAVRMVTQQFKTFENIQYSDLIDTEEKYRAINVKKWLFPQNNYTPVLEFRIIGGENYLSQKLHTVINSLRRYFYIVAVSGDPKLYTKEYLSRLYKIKEKFKSSNQSLSQN